MSKPLHHQVIHQAFELVKNPMTWTQNTMAADKYNNDVDYDDEKAVKFCSIGALVRTVLNITGQGVNGVNNDGHFNKIYNKALHSLRPSFGPEGIPWVNDRYPHEHVIGCWKKAMENLENEQAP